MSSKEFSIWKQKFDVEETKRRGLDVDWDRLEGEGYDSLTPEEFYRLKTWGVCSQRTPGLHMIRIRVPGGRIESGQLRALAVLSAEAADEDGAHITSRQNLELHSVQTKKVRWTLDRLGDLGLSTRSACGHTVRNVVGCSLAGVCADEPFDITQVVEKLHQFFISRAEHYNARLPRRLNVWVAGCARCMSHAQVNDLGFVAISNGDEEGFQLWCAGSLASNPRLAHLLFAFVPRAEVVDVAQAVADVYCENGFRDRPAKARLKFLFEEWGEDRFAAVVMERLREIAPDTRVARDGFPPMLGPDRRPPGFHGGVFAQRQSGYVRIEARVSLGDLSIEQMRTLADLAERYGDGCIYLTPEQNAELHWIRQMDAAAVTEKLDHVGLTTRGAGSLVDVLVCAGTEWCVWGVGDSRGLARRIEDSLSDVVAADPAAEPLRVHISGCHHGCARHQAGDVGLAATSAKGRDGEKVEGYEFFAGGRLGVDPQAGRRVGRLPLDETPDALVGLLRAFLSERKDQEDFASFVERTGSGVGAGLASRPEERKALE